MEVLTGIITDAEIVTNTEVVIDSKLPETNVEVSKSITAEVAPDNYVLSSGGMYGSGFTGAAPTWLLDAIQQELTTGTGSVLSVLEGIQTVLDSLTIGVNQNIAQIESTILSQASLATSVQSQIDANEAAILDVATTRVTPTEAQTIALQVQQSIFGVDATAFIGNIASTYVSPTSAIAQDVSLLTAEVNGISASITTLDAVFVEKGTMLSQMEIETGVSVVDLQGQLDNSISMWYGEVLPTTLNTPASAWITTLEKKAHNGDLYYNKLTSTGYKYVYTTTSEGWVALNPLTEQLKIDALYQGSLREDTIDGKRSVYYTASAPTPMASDGITPIPIETGDLWVDSDNGVTRIRSAGGLWVDITNTATQNALIDLGTLQETNDGVVNTYYQRLAPTTGMSYGDWWVNVVEDYTGTVVPSLVNLPTSAWTTIVAKDSHLGDIYTKTDTLSKYKFKVAAGVYSWELIADVNTIVYATAWRYEDPDGLNKPGMTWVYKDPTQNILANNAVNSELAKRKIAGVIGGTTQINLAQHINGAGWTTDASLTNWISTVFDPFVAQMDNIIETHFGSVVPSLVNLPASAWTDTSTKDLHLGDIYYDSVSGIGYRFVLVGGVYSWSVISDSGVAAALETASHAQDTADGKRRTFISGWDSVNLVWTPVLPIPPYDRGDLFTPLVDTVNGLDTFYKNEVYVCNVAKATGLTFSNADFVAGTNAKVTSDAIADLNSDIGLLRGLVDNKVETFLQPSPPHISPITLPITHVDVPEYDSYINDLWFSNDVNGKTYVYKRTATGNIIVNYGYVTEAYNFPTINNGLIVDPITSSRDLSQGGILQMPTGTNDYVYAWAETPVPKEVFDAIDGKKIIFTTMPSVYFVRDIMIPAVTFVSGGVTFYANEIYISATDATAFDAGHWSKATKYTDDTVADIAVQNAATAQTAANTANNLLADIASDDKLTASEKQSVKLEWDLVVTEVPKVLANATSAGILVTDALYLAYSNVASPYGKYQLLSTYITPLLVDLNATSVIVGTTFRSTFKAYYDAKIELLLAISIKLKDKADAAQAKADGIANGTVAINLAAATIGGVALTTYVAGELDKEVVILSGTATPTTAPTTPAGKLNDIYIQKGTATGTSGVVVDVVNTWKHNGTIWEAIGNNNNLTALADLTDGKRTIYSGGSLPTASSTNPFKTNDLFLPTSTFTANAVIYTENEMYRYNTGSWVKATRYDAIYDSLKTQIDGKIATTYGGATPPIPNGTADLTAVGDYWYCSVGGVTYSAGIIYKYSAGYVWEMSTDISKGAFDLADSKRTIYGNAGTNTPDIVEYPALELNDLWMPSSNGTVHKQSKIYKCTDISIPTWVEADYTDDTVIEGIQSGSIPLDPTVIAIGSIGTTLTSYVASEADKRVHVYSGTTAPVSGSPVGIELNDIYLWFTTATAAAEGSTYDVTRTYTYNSSNVWIEITTNASLTKIADLTDGKRTIYSNEGTTPPSAGVNLNDMWIPSSNSTDGTTFLKDEIYIYKVAGWVKATKYTDDTAVNRILDGTTSIANAKIGATTIGTYVLNAVETGTDNMVHVYSGSEIQKPVTAILGDLYIETHSTTAVVTSYRWNSTAWVEVEGASSVKALQDLTDGKRTIYTTSGIPTNTDATGDLNIDIRDLWIPPATITISTITYRKGEIYICNNVSPITFVVATEYYSLIANVQTQVDGKVDTYYQGTVPYANQTNVPKDIRSGDYWYCTVNVSTYVKGNVYKYVETVNGSNFNYTWTLSADVTKSAFDQIDGKKTIFGGATVPTAIAVNDIWVPSANVGTYKLGFIYQWNGTAWADNVKYTDDTVANTKPNVYSQPTAPSSIGRILGDLWVDTDDMNHLYRWNGSIWSDIRDGTIAEASGSASAAMTAASNAMTAAQTAQATADGAIRTWYQSLAPTGLNATTDIGDMWFDTDDNQAYRWSGTAWIIIEDNSIAVALQAAQTAQTTADGKITSFYQTSSPIIGMSTGDLWYNTADKNKPYYYSGTAWIVLRDGTIADAQTTADTKSMVLYQAIAPTLLTHPLLDNGDQWVNTTTSELKVWNGTAWTTTTNDVANKAYTIATADPHLYNSPASVTPVAVSPIVLAVGDLWVVTDRWYTDATTSASGTTRTAYGYLVKKYNGTIWNDITNTEAKSSVLKWEAKSSKYITAPDGSITGFEMSDGSATNSAFTITADQFKLVASGQSVASRNPMSVDATTGEITFNGKVSFNSVTDVPALGSTPQQVVDAVNAGNTTTINGGKITTGSITAGQIATNTITSSQLTTGIALINGEVKSSDFTSIGGAGFRLKSNAAGTSADPTIYGAYIRGGTIDSSTMNIRNLNVVTDAGQLTSPIFSSSPRLDSGIPGISPTTHSFNIYSYNSTDVTRNKLATYSTTRIRIGQGNIYIGGIEYSGFSGVGGPGYTLTISVYTGTSLTQSASFAPSPPSYATIAGITFYREDEYAYVKTDNTITMAGNGRLAIKVEGFDSVTGDIIVYNI